MESLISNEMLGRRKSLLYEMSNNNIGYADIPDSVKAKLFKGLTSRSSVGKEENDKVVGNITDEEIKSFYKLLDTNADGKVSPKEVDIIVRSMGIKATEAELVEFFREVKAGSEHITYDEVSNTIKQNALQITQSESIKETFAAFDQANKGYITADGLDKVLKNIGFNFTEEEINTIITSLGEDGRISREQFQTFLLANQEDIS